MSEASVVTLAWITHLAILMWGVNVAALLAGWYEETYNDSGKPIRFTNGLRKKLAKLAFKNLLLPMYGYNIFKCLGAFRHEIDAPTRPDPLRVLIISLVPAALTIILMWPRADHLLTVALGLLVIVLVFGIFTEQKAKADLLAIGVVKLKPPS